jgi:hypothetical protein
MPGSYMHFVFADEMVNMREMMENVELLTGQ